ncbi:MAG: transporter substrate-binding domain-containing protein [Bacteroidota bacterium]
MIEQMLYNLLKNVQKGMKQNYIRILFIGLFLFSLSCSHREEKSNYMVDFDIDKIKERGKIVALTGYNAYSYFIYRGKPMGFEYDLVNRLAEHLDVEVEIKVVRDLDQMFEMLNNGEGDIISFNLTVTKERNKYVDFTTHLNTSRQVLIQRKPSNWSVIKLHEIENQMIRNLLDLEGKTIYVQHSSAYAERLKNLSEEIGGDINIIEASPELSAEDLIKMVADGEIEYTVADDNVAKLNESYFSSIDTETFISFPQKIAWAVRKNAPVLKNEINKWLVELKSKPDFYVIYNRYYKNMNAYQRRMESEYFSNTGGKISEYDEVIQKYARNLKWDWRMLASLIYQESKFKPNAESWAGAQGLMQLMPGTAEMFGVQNVNDPHESISAGIKYLNYLDSYWSESITDSLERIKFVLASYNIGPGHIIDARNLAEKYGANPNVWFDNVEQYLLKKSEKQYYTDEVVKLGYSSGKETVNYVKQVLTRFEHYKRFIS